MSSTPSRRHFRPGDLFWSLSNCFGRPMVLTHDRGGLDQDDQMVNCKQVRVKQRAARRLEELLPGHSLQEAPVRGCRWMTRCLTPGPSFFAPLLLHPLSLSLAISLFLSFFPFLSFSFLFLLSFLLSFFLSPLYLSLSPYNA